LLQESAELLEPQAQEKGLEIRVEVAPGLPPSAWLDREKLSRVLVNLVSNAVKVTQKGIVLLRARPWQASVSFQDRDTGCGSPLDLVPAAYSLFRPVRPRTGGGPRGAGLGRTTSTQLVGAMGGGPFLDSREGRGTRVALTVPELPAEPFVEVAPAVPAARPIE